MYNLHNENNGWHSQNNINNSNVVCYYTSMSLKSPSSDKIAFWCSIFEVGGRGGVLIRKGLFVNKMALKGGIY